MRKMLVASKNNRYDPYPRSFFKHPVFVHIKSNFEFKNTMKLSAVFIYILKNPILKIMCEDVT